MQLNYRDPKWPERIRKLEFVFCVIILILGILLILLDEKLSLYIVMLLLIFGTAFAFICFYSLNSINKSKSREYKIWALFIAAGICAFFTTAGIFIHPMKVAYIPILLLMSFSAAIVTGIIFLLDLIFTMRLLYLGIPPIIEQEQVRTIVPILTSAPSRPTKFQMTQTEASMVCPACKQPCSRPLAECAAAVAAKPAMKCAAEDNPPPVKKPPSSKKAADECIGVYCFSKYFHADEEDIDKQIIPKEAFRESGDEKVERKRQHVRMLQTSKVAPMPEEDSDSETANQYKRRRPNISGDDDFVVEQKRQDAYQTSTRVRRDLLVDRSEPVEFHKKKLKTSFEETLQESRSEALQTSNFIECGRKAETSRRNEPEDNHPKRRKSCCDESEDRVKMKNKAVQISNIRECPNYECTPRPRQEIFADKNVQTDIRKQSCNELVIEERIKEPPVIEPENISVKQHQTYAPPPVENAPLKLEKSTSSQTYDTEIFAKRPYIIMVKECPNPVCAEEDQNDFSIANLGAVKKESLSHPGSSKTKQKEVVYTNRRLSNSLQTSPEKRNKGGVSQTERRGLVTNRFGSAETRRPLTKYKQKGSTKENLEFYEMESLDSESIYDSSQQLNEKRSGNISLSHVHNPTDSNESCDYPRNDNSLDKIRPSQIPNNILAQYQPYVNTPRRNGLNDIDEIIRQASPVFRHVRPLPENFHPLNKSRIQKYNQLVRSRFHSEPTTARRKELYRKKEQNCSSDPHRS